MIGNPTLLRQGPLRGGVFQCVAVCCSVLQCFAVYCSVLQCVNVFTYVYICAKMCRYPTLLCRDPLRDGMFERVAVCCSMLQYVQGFAECCNALRSANVSKKSENVYRHPTLLRRGLLRGGVLQRVAVCCSVLQRVAACCSVLQCVAVCCRVNVCKIAQICVDIQCSCVEAQ